MASRSPIVVDSSSQASFRLPSVTPQSHRKAANPADSSSPSLPDLPTFVRVPAKALKSGSNAQQVPESAASGFASAASLLKNDAFKAELEKREQQDAERLGTGKKRKSARLPEKSTGKLSKPKKTQKLAKDVTERRRKPQSPFPPILDNDRESYIGSVANETAPYFGQTKTRTPSISLSDYDFRPEEHQESPVPKVASTKAPKKSKPRVPKEKQSKEDDATKKSKRQTAAKAAPAKKPKKRLAKSESIILNSDDPDQVVDGEATPTRKSSTTDEVLHKSIAKCSEVPSNQPVDDNKQNPETFAFLVQKAMRPHDDGAEVQFVDKSAYFSERRLEEDSVGVGRKDITDNNEDAPSSLNKGNPVLPTLVPAPRRRLSWTPAKNTTHTATTPTDRPGTASSTGSEMRTKSLATLVSGFGYADQPTAIASHERTVTGEALTKRRRIELADASTVAPAKRKSANVEPPEPAKKPKLKKKPQTITALATKAYNIEPDVTPAQSTVSEFFTAPQTIEPPAGTSTELNFVKPKKPRKPRANKAEGDTIGQSVKRPTKSKKTKAKLNEADSTAKLYTPDEARAQEQSQDFLFGSSSQLAAEESPTLIREMQAAIRESESWPGNLSICPRWKSRIQVPSAPHGTNLSIGQGKLDHWGSATRDEDGKFLVEDKMLNRFDARNVSSENMGIAAAASPASEQVSGGNDAPESSIKPLEGTEEQGLSQIASSPKNLAGVLDMADNVDGSNTIDLCQTSPAAEDSEAAANASTRLPEEGDFRPIAGRETKEEQAPSSPFVHPADEIWTFLSSDDSGHQPTGDLDDRVTIRPQSPALRTVSRPPQLIRSVTSPSMHRTVLQSLDANVGLLSHTSPAKGFASVQQRPFTSAPVDQAKRPRGRPRKNAAPTSPTVSSTKCRDRPPKVASGGVTAAASSRARPSKAARTGPSASQPTESTGWTNIDEISESDSPSTPSPPRQRAGSTPPTMQPLHLSVADSPSLKARAPAAVSSILKPNDASFATIQAQLFPEITATVRSTLPSTDMNNPTWHEKILLYDPIVLEDLTTWLNDQGLGIETQRLKPRAKSKGRKKKDAPVEEPEYEVVKEGLKPWMVQKWCEEKSICCLWKEGLRGGVRNRY